MIIKINNNNIVKQEIMWGTVGEEKEDLLWGEYDQSRIVYEWK
jgi:hypothetical protein